LPRLTPLSPNLVLAVLDTTRADALGLGAGGGVAPTLQAASRMGRAYSHATSPAPWTPPAHASMLTGLAPGEHGVWGPNLLDEGGWPRPGCLRGPLLDRWLPALLAGRGYHTLGISANSWIGGHLGFDHGFQRFASVRYNPSGRTRRTPAVRVGHLLPRPLADVARRRRVAAQLQRRGQDWGAGRTLDILREWLAAAPQPFFVFLNFMEPHWPYHPPPDLEGYSAAEARHALDVLARYRGPAWHRHPPPEDAAILRRLYLGEVAYLDRRLAELVELLMALGRFQDTVVVIVADHGEHLGEHGLVGHVASVYEELLHVPLLVLGPQELVGRGVEDARVSTRRLHHALLNWASGEPATLVSDEPVVADYEGLWHHAGSLRRIPHPPGDDIRLKAAVWAIYEGHWKYVRDETGRERLYDLDADPGETTDVQADGPRSALRERLAEVLAERRPCLLGDGDDAADRDLAMEAELRALGYL
jgi:arylsulfatase A-like enzyme